MTKLLLEHVPPVDELLKPSKRIQCPYEGCKEVLYRPAVVKHLKKVHGYDPSLCKILYYCPVDGCDRSKKFKQMYFKTIGLIRQHFKTVHNPNICAKIKCNKCEKTFSSRYYFSQHRRTCQKFFCTCKQSFESIQSLKRHALAKNHQLIVSFDGKAAPKSFTKVVKKPIKYNSSKFKYILPKRPQKEENIPQNDFVLVPEEQYSSLFSMNIPKNLPPASNTSFLTFDVENEKSAMLENGAIHPIIFNSNNQFSFESFSELPTVFKNVSAQTNIGISSDFNIEKSLENNGTQTLLVGNKSEKDIFNSEECLLSDNHINPHLYTKEVENSLKDFSSQTNLTLSNIGFEEGKKSEEISTQTGILSNDDQSWFDLATPNEAVLKPQSASYCKDFASQTAHCDSNDWLFMLNKDISETSTQTQLQTDSTQPLLQLQEHDKDDFMEFSKPQMELKDFSSQTAFDDDDDSCFNNLDSYLKNETVKNLSTNTIDSTSDYLTNPSDVCTQQDSANVFRTVETSFNNGKYSNDNNVTCNINCDEEYTCNMQKPSSFNQQHSSEIFDFDKSVNTMELDDFFCNIETQTDSELPWQNSLTNSYTQTIQNENEDNKIYSNEMFDIETQTEIDSFFNF